MRRFAAALPVLISLALIAPFAAGLTPSADTELLLIGALCYAAAPVGVFFLAKQLRLDAGWTSLCFALAPHRWSDLARAGDATHALGLAVLPFAVLLAVAAARAPRRQALLYVVSASGLTWVAAIAPISGGSLWPEAELGVALLAGWPAASRGRLRSTAACAAIFGGWLGGMAFLEHRAAAPTAWVGKHAPGEAWLAQSRTRAASNPIRRQAERLILDDGHTEASLLWLQALGATHLVVARGDKFRDWLEVEREGVYHTQVRQPSPAVLVSRHQWKKLEPIRSLHDRAALTAYTQWANRPEGARFAWIAGSPAEIRADLGPDDMILVRHDSGGWSATLDGHPLPCRRDPIGFLLLDPPREGPLTIRLARSRLRVLFSPEPRPLPTYSIPVITDGGIRDGLLHTPPPFAPGTTVTIYGADLRGSGATRVLVSGRAIEVLHADQRQVNAQLPSNLKPGPAEIVVEAGGVASRPMVVEIR